MSPAGLRGRVAATPLRVKLVAALIGLLVLGLAITGAATWRSLNGYLLGRVDDTLAATAPEVAGGLAPTLQRIGNDVTQLRCRASDDPGRITQPTPFFQSVSNGSGILTCMPTGTSDESAPRLPAWSVADAGRNGSAPFTAQSVDGSRSWRVQAAVVPGGGAVLFVGTDLSEVSRTLNRLLLIEMVGGLLVLLLLAGAGYAVVRRSLRPLEEVEAAAHDIAAGDLTRRVPEQDPRTEVGRLSLAFNTMLGRIETAFREREESEAEARESEERMRRFVADASHELRTPLTSIRGFAELYRQGAVPNQADIARVMRRIEDQATRMGLLVEDLLMLARLDQQRPLDLQPVDLLTIASEAVHDAQALDPDRPVELRASSADGPPVVLGDDTRLRQVVANLMSNALTHTSAGTPVTVTVDSADGQGVITVADEGPGMSADDAAHVFERFYRADSSRTRTGGTNGANGANGGTGGTGLGLSIAAALVAAHSGTLTVETAPGEGATFTLRVPLAAPTGSLPT